MKEKVVFEDKEYELDYDILAPGIYVYHNAIPKEWDVINRIENALAIPDTRFAWQTAEVGFGAEELEARKCFDFKVDEKLLSPRDQYSSDLMDVHSDLIHSLKTCLAHYNPRNYLAAIDYFECINIVKYEKGEYFKVHTDDGDPYRCTLSAVGYPNDDYEGGEIWFELFDLLYKPVAGDYVVFPSAYSYAHSSEPVTDDGTKYSFVIMTDRNSFAHRADSPVYHAEELRQEHGVFTG